MKKALSTFLAFSLIFTNIGPAFATETSTAPDAANIIVSNNVSKADTVKVTGIQARDVIKVYRDSTATAPVAAATVASTASQATAYITQLSQQAGNVYVSVTSYGKLESKKVLVNYNAEVKSTSPDTRNITVTNNYTGRTDSVKIINLQAGDIVKVYKDSSTMNYWGTTIVASGKTEALLNISQLGKLSGSVYVTVKKVNELESSPTKVDFLAEPVSDSLDASNIIIINNAGLADIIKVTGVVAGDILRVYRDDSTITTLGSYKVPLGKTEGIINVTQLGTTTGNVYVTVKKPDKHESQRVQKSYNAEVQTTKPDGSSITITNNLTGIIDTIGITGLTAGDAVKVYKDSNGTILLGSAVVASGTTTATIKITQLGQGAGNVYVSLKSLGKYESEKVKADYIAEPKNVVPALGTITVKNNAGLNDVVMVSELIAGDIVRVYRDNVSNTIIGSASVASGKTEVVINIPQLGSASGSIYVTVKSTNKLESNRQMVDYAAEGKTANPDLSKIIITNNAGLIVDTVKFTSLTAGDIVKVYKDATITSALSSATVAAGKTEAVVNIRQLGIDSGSVFVTVKTLGQLESNRIPLNFSAEPKSVALEIANITINNKLTGSTDTIVVSGLTEGDIVKVFKDATTIIGTGKVALGSSQATINIEQIGQEAGSVYITVTSTNKNESDRVQAAFIAEPKTDSPDSANITVINYVGINDRIQVTGVNPGDIVKVYRDNSVTAVLALATVRTGTNEVTLFVNQLGTGTGCVYITVKTPNKLESNRVKADYASETKSATPDPNTITITNNAGIADTIKVTGLSQGDTIKVFADAATSTPLGTVTVGSSETEANLSISQLGTSNGTIYISVKKYGQYESDMISVDYPAE